MIFTYIPANLYLADNQVILTLLLSKAYTPVIDPEINIKLLLISILQLLVLIAP